MRRPRPQSAVSIERSTQTFETRDERWLAECVEILEQRFYRRTDAEELEQGCYRVRGTPPAPTKVTWRQSAFDRFLSLESDRAAEWNATCSCGICMTCTRAHRSARRAGWICQNATDNSLAQARRIFANTNPDEEALEASTAVQFVHSLIRSFNSEKKGEAA